MTKNQKRLNLAATLLKLVHRVIMIAIAAYELYSKVVNYGPRVRKLPA